MDADPKGTRLTQIARLRAAGREAIMRFGIEPGPMRLLRHEHNTTFRVASRDGDLVLRINRPGVRGAATIAAETAWLLALRAGTELGVPAPVIGPDGSAVVEVDAGELEGRRACVLLHWQDGRFVDRGLTPAHMRRVAVLQAGLQAHAAGWAPPDGFVRPRVDTLTNAGKVVSIAPGPHVGGPRPADDDAASALDLVRRLMGPADATIATRALEVVRATTGTLDSLPGSTGLIHGDLHQENVLHHRREARAIDFDDCGWGFNLYDLVVSLWELEGRPRYPELRATLLDEYARHRPLPPDAPRHLAALALLRRLQILLWILESRDHPAFRDDWKPWAMKELRGIRAALAAAG